MHDRLALGMLCSCVDIAHLVQVSQDIPCPLAGISCVAMQGYYYYYLCKCMDYNNNGESL